MTGTRAMSGSAATRLRNVTIAASESSTFIHVDVDDLGAVLDLVARHLQAACNRLQSPAAEFGGARDVGALADVDEGDRGRQFERLETRELRRGSISGIARGGCGATAAAIAAI